MGLVAWWGILAATNALWVEAHILALPPPWDPALQQLIGLRVLQAFQESGSAAAWHEMHVRSPFVPPLFPLSTIPLYWLLGPTREVAHFASSLYLLLHLVVVHALGRRVGGAATAALAVFLFSTFGSVVNLSRDYLHDLPAAAFVALALLALVRSEGLTRLAHAAAFGAFTGLAAVTKSMAPAFIIGPAVYAFAVQERAGQRRRTGPLLLALAAAALVALPWWGRHAGAGIWYLWHYGVGEGAAAYAPGGEQLLSLRSLGYYALALTNEGTSVPLALVAVAVALARRVAPRPRISSCATRRLLWVWLASGYIALTLSVNKSPDRYTIFLLTPLALLLAAAIAELRRARTAALAGAVLAGVWSWTAWTLDPPWAPPVVYYRPPARALAFHPSHTWLRTERHVAAGEWPIDATVSRLAGMAQELKRRSSLEYVLRHDENAAPEQQLRQAFLGLLGRDPDPGALMAYTPQFAGARALPEILREIVASEEFRGRPLRVAVAADEPLINAATLNYYAAAQRAAVSFLAPSPSPGDWAGGGDAVLIAEGDDRPMSDFRRRLAAPGSRYERILAVRCPDGRVLEVFAPRSS